MNKYKVGLNLNEYFIRTGEDNSFDGSFKPYADCFRGRTSIVFKPNIFRELFPELAKMYPHEHTSIKIFNTTRHLSLVTKIHRIFSWYGLAPKFYRLVYIEDANGIEYLAQVVEFIHGDYCYDELVMREVCGLMNTVMERNHIEQSMDLYPSNMVGGKWVDFGNFIFKDFNRYMIDVAIRYNSFASWGSGVKSAYQRCERLGINSGRGDERIKLFELDSFDFKNKTVLDIGCSGGYFTNYCDSRGARAVGVDFAEVVQGAKEAANATDYHSEFYPYNFTKEYFVETIRRITGVQKFDYVFFLSMDQHIGFREDYFRELVGDILFFESNGGKPVEEEYDEFKLKLAEVFPNVDFKGVSKEGAHRNLFIAKTI